MKYRRQVRYGELGVSETCRLLGLTVLNVPGIHELIGILRSRSIGELGVSETFAGLLGLDSLKHLARIIHELIGILRVAFNRRSASWLGWTSQHLA